jgi:hypothetical protein
MSSGLRTGFDAGTPITTKPAFLYFAAQLFTQGSGRKELIQV